MEKVQEFDDDSMFWLCMSLNFLRIFHIDEVIDVLRRIINTLSNLFYMYRYFFVNFLSWTLAAFKFLGTVHYFACAWIMIKNMKDVRGKQS